MARSIYPEIYPDSRPSRLLVPLRPYLPALLRLVPWLVAAPVAALLVLLVVLALPLLTWLLLAIVVLAPVAAGLAFFTFGWES